MKIWKRAMVSLSLSLLFLVVYGACNALSSLRTDVGMIYFEWERHIPFVPLMVIPYMSIDLFFVAAPFVCRTKAEIETMARRIVFVILTGGLVFLLFPLEFAFVRPGADGWLGVIFDQFRRMDAPFNLLPSLHIGLRTILAVVYARNTKGIWRIASNIWFSLIGISTVLTYQHHLVDVLGGFVVATLACYLFREKSNKHPVQPNRCVSLYYAVAAGFASILGLGLGLWGLLLLWPATALGLVSAAYLGLGPTVYGKQNGKLPLATRIMLTPTLLGQYLSLLYYRRQCRPWDEITPCVWIGRKLSDTEATEAVQRGVVAVLDLTTEFNEADPFLNTTYLNLPILDLTAPTQQQLREMADFITCHSQRGVVYIHCKIGYSRSAAAVGAWLVGTEQLSAQLVLERLKKARPSIVVRPEIVAALDQFCRPQGVTETTGKVAAGIF